MKKGVEMNEKISNKRYFLLIFSKGKLTFKREKKSSNGHKGHHTFRKPKIKENVLKLRPPMQIFLSVIHVFMTY